MSIGKFVKEIGEEITQKTDLTKSYKKNDQSYFIIGLTIGLATAFGLYKYWQIIENGQYLWVGIIVFIITILGIFLSIFILFRRPLFKMIFSINLENYDEIASNLISNLIPLIKKNVSESTKNDIDDLGSSIERTIRQLLAYQVYSRSRRSSLGWLIALVAGLSGYLGTTLLMKQNKLMQEQNTFLQRQITLQQEQISTDNKNKYLDIIYGDFSSPRKSSALESYVQIERVSNKKAQIENLIFDSLSFSNAKLDSSNFKRITFEKCQFDNVDFSKSRFDKVKFIKCGFTDCKFDSCFLDASFISSSHMSSSFKNSYMAFASFIEGSNLLMSRFDGAFLSSCRFSASRLIGGEYEGTIIDKNGLNATNMTNNQDVEMLSKSNVYNITPYDNNRFLDEWWSVLTSGTPKPKKTDEKEKLLDKNIKYYKLKSKSIK
jgi:uncharacterized protein YjbI with pentapeptide repeats